MITLTIDDMAVMVEEGATVLHACEAAGKEIPRFCYHERLSVAGNCRMCLVEMEKSTKPIASCAVPAAEGMVIKTDSPMVQKAREGVMEFMLINHPLDCPICDQGGECDLQDQALFYGGDRSRYLEPKRAVENKAMGPLISTIMTRCIHCTRCVRFATEVAGAQTMGAIGRGETMEITTYLEQALASELSGNVVDLCPVGALTSRPYQFNARPWELTKIETVDAMDAVGSNIRIDVRGNQVLRVLPRVNDAVNEEWISDKTRHALDGLLYQRLDRPYLRGDSGRLEPVSWGEALAAVAEKMNETPPQAMGAIAGDQCDSESMFALLRLMRGLGVSNTDCRQDGSVIGGNGRFASGFQGLEETDFILLIGANPRHEAAVVNARIRRRWLDDGLVVARIGEAVDLTYPCRELGDNPSVLNEIAGGSHPIFKAMRRAKKPMIILGQGALNRPDSNAILGVASALAVATGVVNLTSNGFNILHTAAARVGGLEMGFLPSRGGMGVKAMLKSARQGDLNLLYLLGADECDLTGISKKCFVVYQGSHGDAGASVADVVLPGAAWCEKDGIFVNSEGRVQHGTRAVFPPGDAREDWAIIRALSEYLGAPLPFESHENLTSQLIDSYPIFGERDRLTPRPFTPYKKTGTITQKPLIYAVGGVPDTTGRPKNKGSGTTAFYMTCPISRHSLVMAECVAAFAPSVEAAA